MDTFVTISVESTLFNKKNANRVINEAFSEIERIEDVLSFYNKDSVIYALNTKGYLTEEEITPELEYLIKKSIYYSKLSDGAFDVTIHPILELWKKGLWKEDLEMQNRIIKDELSQIGYEKITIDKKMIFLDGVQIDLGGIAKGYAADRALKIMRDGGFDRALVNIGGDMAAGDGVWKVALTDPDDSNNYLTSFNISNKAIATSGNYERYFDPSKKVHHIIDPRTGYPASELISVTVIADECIDADALATAVFVLGPEEGLNLVNSLNDVETLIIDKNRNIYRSDNLSRFEDLQLYHSNNGYEPSSSWSSLPTNGGLNTHINLKSSVVARR
ncbi:FAD:protein FMN transferase [Candidatus Methanoliparum sp. LAM-1]|nr:FAD:protein FMN transferase [Candidatus Methanoliparum sp. LAM-1]